MLNVGRLLLAGLLLLILLTGLQPAAIPALAVTELSIADFCGYGAAEMTGIEITWTRDNGPTSYELPAQIGSTSLRDATGLPAPNIKGDRWLSYTVQPSGVVVDVYLYRNARPYRLDCHNGTRGVIRTNDDYFQCIALGAC